MHRADREGAGRRLALAAERLIARFRGLLRDRQGATAIEYGLIVAGISVAIIIVIFVIGEQINDLMELIGQRLGTGS